jgi:predicted nucleotidyltransferase
MHILAIKGYSPVVRVKLTQPGVKVFLFGSRVEGINEYNSDYDIGVMMDNGKTVDHSLILKTKKELDDLSVEKLFDSQRQNKSKQSR